MTSSTQTEDPFDKVASRIATFIRLLSSDRDGEILAAVAAMIRTLKSVGVDIHALAQRVEQKGPGLNELEMRKIFDAGVEIGHARGYQQAMAEAETQKQELKFHNVASTFHAIAVFCQRNYTGGNAKEREFVNHMVDWTRSRDPTERQQDWLEDIYARLGGE